MSVWQGICPPKIEIFMWQLLKGRIMVRDVMYQFGFQPGLNLSCPLCNRATETIDHLFIHCSWTWKLLSSCLNWWEVSQCPNNSLVNWFQSGFSLCPSSNCGRAWRSCFFSVLWSTWEARNQLVFKGKEANSVYYTDLAKFRVAWWYKHYGKGSSESITSILLNLKDVCIDQVLKKNHNSDNWIPPAVGALKFNVDGSARGKPGAAGVGGVLRDSNGNVLCKFSAHIGVQDSNAAEITAIHKACSLCVSNAALLGKDIVIVSDSKVAVSWVNNVSFGNLSLLRLRDLRDSLFLGHPW
ncbi:hypothetical protein LWI29_037228 [Acer saccharum]|uniref:RNase H type-1 domain-containing protein n=1 Tax=Acer saccharum TaxID=4024 RepID=A0AA39W1R5_ACESA|nr:hypothetical protein LWI29_037228 [Acer saccharum]